MLYFFGMTRGRNLGAQDLIIFSRLTCSILDQRGSYMVELVSFLLSLGSLKLVAKSLIAYISSVVGWKCFVNIYLFLLQNTAKCLAHSCIVWNICSECFALHHYTGPRTLHAACRTKYLHNYVLRAKQATNWIFTSAPTFYRRQIVSSVFRDSIGLQYLYVVAAAVRRSEQQPIMF